jgi:hypothetical protein
MKNGIFETFCLKAFSVEKLEMPFLEYKSLNVFLNFDPAILVSLKKAEGRLFNRG